MRPFRPCRRRKVLLYSQEPPYSERGQVVCIRHDRCAETIMHWLDTLYLALIILAAALGAWTGLLWQAARLANLAVAGYATLALHERAAAWASQHLAQGASE